MEFCISCENESVVFGKVKIKVGREHFETEAEHCDKCGTFGMTPQIQKQIDEWAMQFTKSIVELQPYFTQAMMEKITALSQRFSLNKTEFVKLCTTFYLTEMTKIPNFKALRGEVLAEAGEKYQGARSKICVPIKYQLFKKIDLFERVWKLEYDANVVEEAVQFCVTVLDDHISQIEETKKQELVHFVETHAMAS